MPRGSTEAAGEQPSLDEARAALERFSRRLAKGVAIAFVVLLASILAVECLRVTRLLGHYGFSLLFRQGGFDSLIGLWPLPLLAIAGWWGAPRLLTHYYGGLLRGGRLVEASVIAGPERLGQRLRNIPLMGVVDRLLALGLPTRLVTYRVEGIPSVQTGALYDDESLGPDGATRWALIATEDGVCKAWLFRRSPP